MKPVAREKIPWYPSLDDSKCDGCGECFKFCPQGVYAWDEMGRIVTVVQRFGCVVGCSGCQPICPKAAISFPDIDAIQDIIRNLREDRH